MLVMWRAQSNADRVVRESIKAISRHALFSSLEEGKRAGRNFPTLHISLPLTSNYSAGGLEPSVAQPPLPLQEFLPWQPLSPALQPPLPLQELWPLQACFSLACLSAFLSCPWSSLLSSPLKEAFSHAPRAQA